jgi:hypothetical protein
MRLTSVTRGVVAALVVVSGFAAPFATPPLLGQTAPALSSIALSADTVGIGDVFELTLSLELPADRIAYFPDSLPASAGFATFDLVEWSADRGANGSATLSIKYRLLAVQVGIVSVPPFDVHTRVGRPSSDALAGGWEDFLARPSLNSSADPLRVPESRLWVASVLMLDDITNGLRPRPTDDVWGGNRHWLATLLMVAFGTLLLGVGGTTVRDWLRSSSEVGPEPSPRSPREIALAALDDLLAAGLHSNGRIDDFYLRTSDITRRYIETLDDSWDATLTSRELMAELGQRSEAEAGAELVAEMGSAETVKFGRVRPETLEAEAHWHALRDWIAGSVESPQ